MSKRGKVIFFILIVTVIFIGMNLAKQHYDSEIKNTEQNIENQLLANTLLDDSTINSICQFIENNKDNSIVSEDLTNFIIQQTSIKSMSDITSAVFYINILPVEGTLYGLYPNNEDLKNLHKLLEKYSDTLQQIVQSETIKNTSSGSDDASSSDTDVSTSNSNTNSSGKLTSPDGYLELESQYGAYDHITGVIKNLSPSPYSYVEVNINLYDDNGNQVESTLANTNNLEANGTWNFSAPELYPDKSTKYRVISIEGMR